MIAFRRHRLASADRGDLRSAGQASFGPANGQEVQERVDSRVSGIGMDFQIVTSIKLRIRISPLPPTRIEKKCSSGSTPASFRDIGIVCKISKRHQI